MECLICKTKFGTNNCVDIECTKWGQLYTYNKRVSIILTEEEIKALRRSYL